MAEPTVADLMKRIVVLEETLNLYRQHGLDALRTRALSYHPVAYTTAAPTERGAQGEPRLVATGGARYIYFNIDGGTTWERAALV